MKSALVLLVSWSAAALAEPLPSVTGAHIPEPPPTASVAAAYFEVHNPSERVVEIRNAADSTCSERVSLHRTEIDAGVARMKRAGTLAVPPGGSLAFEPGGLHAMLEDGEFRTGSVCRFELVLGGGRRVAVEAEIRPRSADSDPSHSHSHSHSH